MTALKRRLMPIIRYPAGDRAQWVDPPGTPHRKFLLLGRADDVARVASLSVAYDEVETVVKAEAATLGAYRIQLIAFHAEAKDGLRIRVGSPIPENERPDCAARIVSAFYQAQPIFQKFVDEGRIHPLQIEWRAPSELETNARTGKLRRVMDRRSGGVS